MSLEGLSANLKKLLDGTEESENTSEWLVRKVPYLMAAVEDVNSVHELSGDEKKRLVVKVICDYINEEEEPWDNAALYFAQNVLPALIDTLVSVDKHEIRIKAKRCFSKIFACCIV